MLNQSPDDSFAQKLRGQRHALPSDLRGRVLLGCAVRANGALLRQRRRARMFCFVSACVITLQFLVLNQLDGQHARLVNMPVVAESSPVFTAVAPPQANPMMVAQAQMRQMMALTALTVDDRASGEGYPG